MVTLVQSENMPLNEGKLGAGGGGGGGPSVPIPGDLEDTYSPTITNPGAETGDMTGWDTDISEVTTNESGVPGPATGTYFFLGGMGDTAYMRQTIAIPSEQIDNVATGTLSAILKWKQGGSDLDEDGCSVSLEFRDFDGVLLGDIASAFYSVNSDTWEDKEFNTLIPYNARSIQISFDYVLDGGSKLNCYVDDIEIEYVVSAQVEVDLSKSFVVIGQTSDTVRVFGTKIYAILE